MHSRVFITYLKSLVVWYVFNSLYIPSIVTLTSAVLLLAGHCTAMNADSWTEISRKDLLWYLLAPWIYICSPSTIVTWSSCRATLELLNSAQSCPNPNSSTKSMNNEAIWRYDDLKFKPLFSFLSTMGDTLLFIVTWCFNYKYFLINKAWTILWQRKTFMNFPRVNTCSFFFIWARDVPEWKKVYFPIDTVTHSRNIFLKCNEVFPTGRHSSIYPLRNDERRKSTNVNSSALIS